MDIQVYNIIFHIKGSIRWIVSRKPELYQMGPNYVALFWKIGDNQDSIYDMFNSSDDMDFYYNQLKNLFEREYPTLYLDVKYTYGPVELNNMMYSRIVYYYYHRSFKNSNVFFVS